MVKKGDAVVSSDECHVGKIVGDGRACRQVEGCRGLQVPVRWDDGKLTWPCTKGLVELEGGWKIR